MNVEKSSDFTLSLKVGDIAFHKYYQRNVIITCIKYNALSQNLLLTFKSANSTSPYWDSSWFLPPNNVNTKEGK